MSKMNQKELDNRANQLNRNNPEFRESRMPNLTPEAVADIQRAEVLGSGKQSPKGPGAKAQKALDKKGQ